MCYCECADGKCATVSVLMECVLCECADGTCVTVSVLMESMLVSKR